MRMWSWEWRWGWGSQRNTRKAGDGKLVQTAADDDAVAEVPDLRDALPHVIAEFQRARRYERTFTVALFTVAHNGDEWRPGGGQGDGRRADSKRRRIALASALRQAMRETDLVTRERGTAHCIIVMPEIGTEEGRRAVARMRGVCASRLACGVRAEIAEFPADGWTFEELLAVARKRGLLAAESREREQREEDRTIAPVNATASE